MRQRINIYGNTSVCWHAHYFHHASQPRAHRRAESAHLEAADIAAGKAAWQQLQEAMAAERAALWLDTGGGSQRHSLWQLLTDSIASPTCLTGQRMGAFVDTPTAVVNLQRLLLGLCRGQPMLVKGPPGGFESQCLFTTKTHSALVQLVVHVANTTTGCGKTAMVEEIAHRVGTPRVVRLHLDDQTDARSLLGAYVATHVAGEFVWQPGPLAQVGVGTLSTLCYRAPLWRMLCVWCQS